MATNYQVAPKSGMETANFDYKSDSNYFRDQLAMMKENLLNPAEVKFKIQEQNGGDGRNNLKKSVSSDIGSFSSTSTNKEKRKIPDGGYGWVVVFASLMISLIADGISFSFGLLYTEFLNYFEESPTKTAWIGSLFLAVPLISGPLMSNLVDRYGCQKMTMLGGVLGCIGFVLSAVSNSVEMLFLTFGIVAGLGLGIIYVTAVVSIAFWFETKRTFAIGIGASGTGIGTFLYAPFTQWLISYYGWRGATLILGGTLFNFSVFGALMIDPEWLIEENRLESRSQSIQTFSNSSVALDEIKKLIETGAPKEDLLDTLVTNLNTEANQQIQDPDIVKPRKFQSEILLPTFISSHGMESEGFFRNSRPSLHPHSEEPEDLQVDAIKPRMKHDSYSSNPEIVSDCNEKSSTEQQVRKSGQKSLLDHIFFNKYQEFDIPQPQPEHDNENIRSGVHGSRLSFNETILIKPSPSDAIKETTKRRNTLDVTHNSHQLPLTSPNDNPYRPTTVSKAISRSRNPQKKLPHLNPVGNLKNIQSLKYSNYMRNFKGQRNSVAHRGHVLHSHKYRQKASSCPNIYRNSMANISKESDDAWYTDCLDMLKEIFDFSLFWQYKFGMMSLSTLLLYSFYIIVYFYIPEFVLVFGYTEEQSAYLISVIGIFNTVGMIGLGWVGDQPWCHVTKTYGICMFICGLSMVLIPLVTWSYSLLMLLCAIFGITFGSSFSFTPQITSKLVDMEDFTLAYGLILLVQGIGSLVGPPLAGWIFDLTNRWDDSFYIGGAFVVLSGILGYIIGELRVETDDDDEESK